MMIEASCVFLRTVLALFIDILLVIWVLHIWRWIKKQFQRKDIRTAAFEDLHKILKLSEDVDNRVKGMEHQFSVFAKRLTEAEKLIQELKNKQIKNKKGA